MKHLAPTLKEWNWYVLMLNQALIGAITPNFRMISLKFTNELWIIEAILEKENPEDEEEIIDISEDFSVYIEDIRDEISSDAYKEITTQCIISNQPLTVNHLENTRIVFKRKEIVD